MELVEIAIMVRESYLSNRYQCVHENNCSSDWLQVNTGIPPGSVLGAFLFLDYINDIKQQFAIQMCFYL